MKCGEGIKARRLRAGLTRVALAEKSGVSAMTIRRYETLEREPRFDALEKLATALGCAVFDFTGDREEKNMSIGENIRQARKTRGFTQQELADAAGINVQTVRSYEAGKYCPKKESLSRLAAALDCEDLSEGIEVNEGYEIVEAEAYRTNDTGRVDRIVLGRMDTKYGVMWVTWESAAYPHEGGRLEYFWGHYHDDERKARADYHRRLIEKYE